MCDQRYELASEAGLGRDLAIPAMDKVAENDGEEDIKVGVDGGGGGEGGEEVGEGRGRRRVRAERAPD